MRLFSCFAILLVFTGLGSGNEASQENGSLFDLPNGYSMELVLSAPTISDPVAMAWDGNGVLYLVEERPGFRENSRSGKPEKNSVISRHEDLDGDGNFDTSTIFVDESFSPRQVLPLDHRILATGSSSLDLYIFEDTDGDGVADEKERVFRGVKVEDGNRNLSGPLVWGIDNWIYSNRVADRYRFRNGSVAGEVLPHKKALLGFVMSNEGHFFCIDKEGGRPSLFQQALAYESLSFPQQFGDGFDDIPSNRDLEMPINPEAGYASPGIFRGDQLPESIRGNLFLTRPGEGVLRSVSVRENEGIRVLANQFSNREFLMAKDPQFSPVAASTGPDGRLYLLDRQVGASVSSEPESSGGLFSRLFGGKSNPEKSKRGRVFRLVHSAHEGAKPPRLLDQSTRELVGHLSHPNGWRRDMAQRLVVLREDRQSVYPDLEAMLGEGDDPIARLHALWTIDGLGRASYELLVGALRDPDPRVQAAAVRISELFIRGRDPIVGVSVRAISKNADVALARQIVTSIRKTETDDRLLLGVEEELYERFADQPAMVALGPPVEKMRPDSSPPEEVPKALLPPLESWVFQASHSANTLRRAFDGKLETRYATGGSQRAGMWIQVEFPDTLLLDGIALQTGSSADDFPRGYEVLVSTDGTSWSEPVAAGEGAHPETAVSFPTVKAKFLRVALTKDVPNRFWSVHEWKIFGKLE